MNCPECQELLQRRLDGEILANSPELERHLSECLACRFVDCGVSGYTQVVVVGEAR